MTTCRRRCCHCLETFHHYLHTHCAPAFWGGAGEGKTFDIIRSITDQVDRHFKEKKQVQDYAEILRRSPKTLSNLFSTCGLPSPLRVIHDRIEAESL